MDRSAIIIPSFLLLIMIISSLPFISSAGCSISNCGAPCDNLDIRFPFRIQGSNQPNSSSCGYPGFEVSCEGSKQTLIELPSSESFSVKNIDYAAQEIWVNDPNNCLPKRLLTLNLSGSPFTGLYSQDFSFLNCSENLASQSALLEGLIGPIPCLSGSHHFVFGLPTNSSLASHGNHTWLLPSKCSSIGHGVKVPVQWPVSLQNQTGIGSLNEDLRLTWFMPDCRPCELNGQMCGLNTTSNGSQAIACWNIPNQGKSGKLPISTFIAVALVICAPSIVCLVGSLWIWTRACYRSRLNRLPVQNASIVTPRLGRTHTLELGLEEAGVEFGRQMVRLGLNAQPRPDDQPKIDVCEVEEAGSCLSMEKSTCPICMSEYRPKDKIGTLPLCKHHFHAVCISKWLQSRGLLERTCPICRSQVAP